MNYLLPSLESYFKEMVVLDGRLVVLDVFLNGYKKKMLSDHPVEKEIIGSIISYRDISRLTPGNNLYSPNYSHSLVVRNLDTDIEDILSQSFCLLVSQGYEVFESFLISILTELFYTHPEELVKVKLLEAKILLGKQDIRNLVKQNQRVNNKGLLTYIRKLSPHFANHERNNIHKVNITQWFDLFSMIRHTLIHNRQIISHRLLNYIEKQKANALFDKHFKRRKIGSDVHIFLDRLMADEIMHWLNSFAYFIFKSLSQQYNLSSSVPEYIPEPPKFFTIQ